MIGSLPTTLNVGGEDRRIRSDFRTALLILEAYADPDLTDYDKCVVCVECLFEDEIPPELYDDALKQACWYLDGGNVAHSRVSVRVIDWAQDEAIIFPAINKVLGWFQEIGEGALSTIVGIRYKLARGKQLEKWERDYLRDNGDRVRLKQRYSAEEQVEIDRLQSIFR